MSGETAKNDDLVDRNLEEVLRGQSGVSSASDVTSEALVRTLGRLGLLAGEAEPSPGVKAKLLRQVAGPPEIQPWKAWTSDKRAIGFEFVGKSDAPWEKTAIPGIETRRLFVSREQDRVTMMVRMAPGTSYPAHRHGGTEECFVLEGDLCVGSDLHMHAGDYQRASGESIHPVQSTVNGCVLLLVSSLRDEVI